jgi:hypothetical protein
VAGDGPGVPARIKALAGNLAGRSWHPVDLVASPLHAGVLREAGARGRAADQTKACLAVGSRDRAVGVPSAPISGARAGVGQDPALGEAEQTSLGIATSDRARRAGG